MKNEFLYNKTVDILVQAYFNDTLEHENCYACAVGNLVAGNLGYGFRKARTCEEKGDSGGGSLVWTKDKSFANNLTRHICNGERPTVPKTKIQLKATGYTFDELVKIEFAFEHKAKYSNSSEEYMFNGLMAVIDVLDEIHENKDVETTKSTKQKFHKQLA